MQDLTPEERQRMTKDGWEQIQAGLDLIVWSKLAHWNAPLLTLGASKSEVFESEEGWQALPLESGRLLCWLAFGVGGEYLVKGAFMLNGHSLASDVKVIRPPLQGEKIEAWTKLVNTDDPTIYETDISFGTLGKQTLAELPWEKIVTTAGHERNLVSASIKLLASAIRNRDAHRYKKGVRGFNFPMVESHFVPAFNILLASVNQEELRRCSIQLLKFRHSPGASAATQI